MSEQVGQAGPTITLEGALRQLVDAIYKVKLTIKIGDADGLLYALKLAEDALEAANSKREVR